MKKPFKAPDGRSYLLNKRGEVVKINGKILSLADREKMEALGYFVEAEKIKTEKEVKNAN